MAQVLPFYSGPASSVQLAGTPYGECQDVIIKWEPTGPETMDKAPVQTGGLGTIEFKAMAMGSGSSGTLQVLIAGCAEIAIIVTTAKALFTIVGAMLEYGYSGEFNDPGKTTTANIKATKWTATRALFCTIVDV